MTQSGPLMDGDQLLCEADAHPPMRLNDYAMNENELVNLIAELFRRLGYSVEREVRFNYVMFDLVISKDGLKSPVEIKIRNKNVGISDIVPIFNHLHTITFSDDMVSPIVVALPGLTAQAKDFARAQKSFRVWESDTLVDKSQPYPDLHKKLVHLMDSRAASAPPYSTDSTDDKEGRELIRRLEQHLAQNTLTANEYEQLCQQVFTYVFDPYLYDFRRQVGTSDGANRYDFICRINSGNEFWDTLKRDFKTRAVLFECKNYNDKITVDQVYSTERDLFNSALRTVCFLISRLGPDEGCIRAAQGAMREAGKLVLLLSNGDLVELIRLTPEAGGPENYLDEKIWDFVVSLPR
jgi:hypothetical protein